MKIRLYAGNILFWLGIVLLFCGVFSARPDIRAGIFGISSIYWAEGAVVILIVGFVIKPRKRSSELK
jgi:hypothetical protein